MEEKSTINRLQEILAQFQAGAHWGSVEIEFRRGIPVIIRRTITERKEETTYNEYRNHRP